jgi:hypothetical protein
MMMIVVVVVDNFVNDQEKILVVEEQDELMVKEQHQFEIMVMILLWDLNLLEVVEVVYKVFEHLNNVDYHKLVSNVKMFVD